MPITPPENVKVFLDKHFPETHEMFWILGSVLKIEETARPPFLSQVMFAQKEADQIKDTIVMIEDHHSPTMAYTVRLEGTGYDLGEDDIVSLLGHSVKNGVVENPRMLFSHSIGKYYHCFNDTSEQAHPRNQAQHKKALSVALPRTPDNVLYGLQKAIEGWFTSELTPNFHKRRNMVFASLFLFYLWLMPWLFNGAGGATIYAAAVAHPILLIPLIPMVTLFVLAHVALVLLLVGLPAVAFIYGLFRLLLWMKEPTHFRTQRMYSFAEVSGWTCLTDYFGTVWVDQTYTYESAGAMLHDYVLATGTVKIVRGTRRDALPSANADDNQMAMQM